MRHARLLALPAAALLSLAACDNDPVATELREATIQLDSLAAGGARRPTLEHEIRTYEQVAGTARRLASSAQGGQKAAAQLLSARAELGLAENALARALEASRTVESHLRDARTGLSSWNALSSKAAALTGADPQAAIDRIEASIPEKQGELNDAQQEHEALEAEIADLRAKADELDSQALEFRDQALTKARETGEQTDRVENASEVRNINRLADRLESKAALQRAEADIKSRDLPTLQIALAERERQLSLLVEARDSLIATRDDARAEVERLGTAAEETAASIVAALNAAKEAHETLAAPEYEQAAESFGRARSAASQARSVDRRGATVLLSEANHGLAGVMMSGSMLSGSRLDALETVASAEPGIPGRDGLTAELLELRESFAGQRTEAVEAYREAISTVESVGASGDLQQTRLDNALRDLYAVIGEEPPVSEVDDGGDGSFDASDGQASGDETVEGFMARVTEIMENERFGEIRGLVRAEREPAVDLVSGVEDVVSAFGRLDAAMNDQFGTGLTELAEQQAEAGGMPLDPSQLTGELGDSLDPDSLVINYEGDDVALLSAPETPDEVMVLARTESGWVLDLDETLARSEEDAAQLEALTGLFPQVVIAMDAVADEINAGTHGTPGEAMQSLMGRMMPLIFGLMGQMQAEGAG